MKFINRDIRGKYLVDNSGILRERMPRGENIRFIANYVFANPCVGANECRRALLQWRGFKQCDDSRGQYASYFYDRYHYKWYHSKVWSEIITATYLDNDMTRRRSCHYVTENTAYLLLFVRTLTIIAVKLIQIKKHVEFCLFPKMC